MTEYTRVIRGIERSVDYTRPRPATRYAAYRLSAYEQAAGVQRQDGLAYSKAAENASSWLGLARDAQKNLDGMMTVLGRNNGIRNRVVLEESIERLVQWINEWESGFRHNGESLKPEIWEAVELALRHPAMEVLGIQRSTVLGKPYVWTGGSAFSGHQALESAKTERTDLGSQQQLRRLLLGAEGLLMDLKRALSYAELQRPVDLLRLPFATAYPYALYYGASSQIYWQLPPRGAIINKYV